MWDSLCQVACEWSGEAVLTLERGFLPSLGECSSMVLQEGG